MQMNRWLTHAEPENEEPFEEASHHPVRPRASVWIDPVVQQNVSASSIVKERRSIPNPSTPIPARASAQPVKVRPRYPRRSIISQESDITRTPTLPQPTMWQYELPDYEAESSLSSLSLAYPEVVADHSFDEVDTLPPPQSQMIDEIETLPPPRSQRIDEIDTLPPSKHNTPVAQKSATARKRKHVKGKSFSFPFSQSSEPQRQKSLTLPTPHTLREVAPVHPQAATVAVPSVPHTQKMPGLVPAVRTTSTIVESALSKHGEEAASWTTGQGKNSLLAQRIASRTNNRRGQRKSSLSLNPIDRLRWWLLFPGRIEFLLWLNGTIVLVAVTCLLLFATLLSTGWMNAGLSSIAIGVGGGAIPATGGTPAGGSKSASGKSSSCGAGNVSNPHCQSTTVVSASGLQLTLVDNTILLPNTPIYLHGQSFSPNNTVTFSYDTSLPCRPSITTTDTQGSFSIFLMLGVGVKAGTHSIVAYDVVSKRSVKLNVTISPLPIGKGVSPTPTPLPPGVTPTATTVPGGGGGFPTPVGQTPVPVTPTVGATPTTVPTQRPTPTVGVTPPPTIGVTPTVGTTPTVGITQTPPTGTKHVSPASLLKNALYDEHADGHLTLSPWLWAAIIGYMLSMLMLGLAGILYRRNHRLPLR